MFHNFTPLQIFCNRIYIFGAETMQILPRNATQKQFDKKNFCSFSHPFLKYGTGFCLTTNFCAYRVESCKRKFCLTIMFYCSKPVEHNNRLKRRDNCLKRLKNKTFLPFYKDKAFEKQQNLLANATTNSRSGMAFCFLSKQNLLVFSLFFRR